MIKITIPSDWDLRASLTAMREVIETLAARLQRLHSDELGDPHGPSPEYVKLRDLLQRLGCVIEDVGNTAPDVRPVMAVRRIVYSPEGYLTECASCGATPTQDGFLEFVERAFQDDVKQDMGTTEFTILQA